MSSLRDRLNAGISRQVFDAAVQTFDRAVIDGTGQFLVGQLEKIDPTLHEPLVAYTWSRDVDLREDVTFADDVASYTVSSFAAPGGVVPNGINWIGSSSNAIPGPSVDLNRIAQPLHQWGMELSWTLRELERSMKLGNGIDIQKLNVMKLKHQMDCDQMVYVGDSNIGATGLVNSQNRPGVTLLAATAPLNTLAPTAALDELNRLSSAVYEAGAFTSAPTQIRLPPQQFAKLAATQLPSQPGSVLGFLRANSLSTEINNTPVEIRPLKWLKGAGVGGTDRALVYTKSPDRVRFPMTQLDRTPLEYRSLWQMVTYYGLIGQLEIIYPETVGYMDGI